MTFDAASREPWALTRQNLSANTVQQLEYVGSLDEVLAEAGRRQGRGRYFYATSLVDGTIIMDSLDQAQTLVVQETLFDSLGDVADEISIRLDKIGTTA